MTRLRLILIILFAAIICLTLYTASRIQSETNCIGLEININYEQGNFFINKSDIEKIVRQQTPSNSLNLPAKDLNLSHIEYTLEQNPYIARAEAYIDINHKLWIDIEQHNPIIRIIDAQNLDYYLSKDGQKMPTTSEYTARVPIVSGNIKDNGKNVGDIATTALQNIYALAQYIDKNQFEKSLIEQIYVSTSGDYIMIPKIGDCEIIFGNIENLENKFSKLHTFYQEALPNIGWDKYKTINLKFKNQIVAVKK